MIVNSFKLRAFGGEIHSIATASEGRVRSFEAVEKLHLDPGTSLTRKCLCAVIPEAVVGNPFFLRELGYPPSRLCRNVILR